LDLFTYGTSLILIRTCYAKIEAYCR
jgi:hypothetical protein